MINRFSIRNFKKLFYILFFLSILPHDNNILSMEKAAEKDNNCDDSKDLISKIQLICVNCKKRETLEKFKVCSLCKMAHYCGPECQQKDWPQHKKICSEFSKTLNESLEASRRDSLDALSNLLYLFSNLFYLFPNSVHALPEDEEKRSRPKDR